MDSREDIVGLGVPFSAGIAAGLALSGAAAFFVPAASVLLLAAVFVFHRSPTSLKASFLMLATGAVCGLLSSFRLEYPSHGGAEGLALRANAAFRNLISSVPYSDEEVPALLSALFTGDRSLMSGDTVRIFRESGASHILALSGLHLGILYTVLRTVLRPAGNSRAAGIIRSSVIVAAAGIYVLMTGASASLVRAFLFITVSEAASIAGRKKSPLNVLLTALVIQLAASPEVIKDVGFQLSYLAMAGIILVYPRMKSWYPQDDRTDPLRWVWNTAALSLSCQLFTAPLAWFRFGTFPQYFLITNMLAMPLTSLVMILSLAVFLLSAFGICPEFLLLADEWTVKLLLSVLRTVASL